MPTKPKTTTQSKKNSTKLSPERQQLKNVRAYHREMSKWSDWANKNLSLKDKATQRKAKEQELLTKYGFKK